jgi:hypothetical protein
METQETIDFIADVEKHLANSNVVDTNGNVITNFKVLYGKIKVDRDLLEIESVYPISEGMKVLIASRRVLYPENIQTSKEAIFIAIDSKGLLQAEEHDFVKSLGHPTTYREIEEKYIFLNIQD